MDRETHDKIVASAIDFGSIFVAYQLGMAHFGLLGGLGYGMFDAWIVIWQKDRISNFVHKTGTLLRGIDNFKRKDAVALTV